MITDGKTHVGCEALTEQFEQGNLRPLLHCFGHIHGKYGKMLSSRLMNDHSPVPYQTEAYGSHLQTWDKKASGHPQTLLLNAALVEMNTKLLVAQSVIKLPILTLMRWLGYQSPAWLQVGLKYSVKNL